MNRIIFQLLVWQMVALAQSASSVETADEPVKALMRRYTQVESQLDRSVHYLDKKGSGADTVVEQAWYNGAGDLLKVSTERVGPSGRELKEYFPDERDEQGTMFVLTRRENRLPDGGTRVDEERAYFGRDESGSLVKLRELTKSAQFKPGEPLEMEHVTNVVHGVAKRAPDVTDEQAWKTERELLEEPQKIAKRLQAAGVPERDPGTENKGDSDKYRIIRGSASPDGRYAIALGFVQKENINWDDYKEEGEEGMVTYSAEADVGESPGIVNYLVDLGTHRILGKTGCEYFGTRKRYNHRECFVFWSPDCATFVQLAVEKWDYACCRAGRIAAGPKLIGTVDLGKAAEKASFTFLAHKRAKDRIKGSIAIHVGDVSNDGVIRLQLWSQSPSVPNKGDVYFTVTERLRLQTTFSGLSIQTLDVRSAPNE